jgi:formylglycine-generating enzyme required for sulfatase activity
MLSGSRRFSLVLLLILGPTVYAAERAVPIQVRAEMVENDLHGQPVKRCGVEGQLDRGRSGQWCFFYGDVASDQEGGWAAIRSGSGCHDGPCGGSTFRGLRGNPYLIVDVSARPSGPIDRHPRLEASISLQKLTGYTGGRPIYQQSRNDRTLIAAEQSEVVVPLLVADAKEKETFGAHEVLLRWRVRELSRSPSAAHGKIKVTSDIPRADVLLDGGRVGRTSDSKPTLIENVAVGEHELSVRDFSGRDVRKRVRVEKDRIVDITLNLLVAARSAPPEELLPIGRNQQGHEEYWRSQDETLVVRIPGGPFEMGSPYEEGEPGEHPLHLVDVGAFLMDKTEVTWGQFNKFSEATGAPLPTAPLWGTPDDYPVTGVTWQAAGAFCEWVGGRLPTEAEWEKAARGTTLRRYPWGDEFDENRCNTRDGGPHRPMGVGVFPDCLSPYGLLDMSGSAWEWCEDWYDDGYYQSSPPKNPRGPSSGHRRVTRGGAWLSASVWVRAAHRHAIDPTWSNSLQGFRCVQSASDDARFQPAGVDHPSTRQVEIEMEVVSNPTDGRPVDRCMICRQVETGALHDWWITFGEARVNKDGERIVVRAGPRCGFGALDHAATVERDSAALPFLILELKSGFMTKPESLTEGSVTMSARKFSGLSDRKPSNVESSQVRVLRIEEFGVATIPLFVATAEEKESLGVHELLLRVRARPATPPAATYGVVSLTTDTPGAAILLNGGMVGHASEHGTLLVRNVPAGEHELAARDSSSHEVRRRVDVLPHRTVAAALRLSKPPALPPSSVLTPLEPNREGYPEYRRERDDAVMVRVPEGEFIMGNLKTERQPLPHKVQVSSFLIDKTPVTWGQYEKFSQETSRPLPPEPYWGIHDDHPVSFVTWEESRAYCEWVGGRLPTEAEREKAACGTDGRMYPWGEEEPTPEQGVFRHNWGELATEAVGTHPAGASPHGLLDMGGNVWEWCEDWYEEKYYETSPVKNPRGPRSGRARVVRGGSWDSRPAVLSCSCRNWGYVGYREGDFGFRCAAEVPNDLR